jgi:hypothetical protein
VTSLVEAGGGIAVIGSKKLGIIRQELRSALTATGEDPIRWLEERLTAAERQGTSSPAKTEVLNSLRRILETPRQSGRRQRRVSTKKS